MPQRLVKLYKIKFLIMTNKPNTTIAILYHTKMILVQCSRGLLVVSFYSIKILMIFFKTDVDICVTEWTIFFIPVFFYQNNRCHWVLTVYFKEKSLRKNKTNVNCDTFDNKNSR